MLAARIGAALVEVSVISNCAPTYWRLVCMLLQPECTAMRTTALVLKYRQISKIRALHCMNGFKVKSWQLIIKRYSRLSIRYLPKLLSRVY